MSSATLMERILVDLIEGMPLDAFSEERIMYLSKVLDLSADALWERDADYLYKILLEKQITVGELFIQRVAEDLDGLRCQLTKARTLLSTRSGILVVLVPVERSQDVMRILGWNAIELFPDNGLDLSTEILNGVLLDLHLDSEIYDEVYHLKNQLVMYEHYVG